MMDAQAVWNDFSEGVHRFIRARVPTDADADDILQDVFVKIVDREDQLRDQDRLAGWVFRIASNAVVDHHRSTRAPHAVTPEPASLEVEAATELAQCVRPFIDTLDEPYRSALIWTDIEGLTQRAAAERAGISVSGMKSRVQRGRAQLRRQFEACCEIELDTRNRIMAYEPRCGPGGCASNDCGQ